MNLDVVRLGVVMDMVMGGHHYIIAWVIWRNGPYIGGHLAFFFKLNFKHVYNLR